MSYFSFKRRWGLGVKSMNRAWTPQDIIEQFDINENFVFFDLGINCGQELDFFIPLGIEIHGFEPHPELAKFIKQQFKRYDNLYFNEAAAWIKNESKILYYGPDTWGTVHDININMPGGSTLFSEKINVSGDHFVSVNCIDISEYILNLNRQINVMKMDIEGAEYHILRHLIESGTINKIDNIFFEDHSKKIPLSFSEFYENKKFFYERINSLNTNFGRWA